MKHQTTGRTCNQLLCNLSNSFCKLGLHIKSLMGIHVIERKNFMCMFTYRQTTCTQMEFCLRSFSMMSHRMCQRHICMTNPNDVFAFYKGTQRTCAYVWVLVQHINDWDVYNYRTEAEGYYIQTIILQEMKGKPEVKSWQTN